VPKTGGSWAVEAMQAAGVPAVHPAGTPGHATLAESRDFDDRFTFGFIRHPLDYWRSYWAFRVRTGWEMRHPLDRDCATDNFEEFIEGVITHAPGEASELFERFVGPPDREITFIGRYEHLVDDVCFALATSGQSFDERALRSHPKVNASDYGVRGGRYPRSLAVRLAEVERRGIERFYSWDPIPAGLLLGGAGATARQHGRELAELTLRLRNARAELEQTRSTLDVTQSALHDARGALYRSELARQDVQHSLDLVQNSHLQRHTRHLRRLWYRCRDLPELVSDRASGVVGTHDLA
jgi:hypothetical protein